MEFTIRSIGTVQNERETVKDDFWGGVVSSIQVHLDEGSLDGIEEFSHLEILYVFHLADDGNIQYEARNPRNNPAYPKVGIFAQRGKNRPNKIGATIVELIGKEGNILVVKGLDAIDGTPVIDIKPVMKEFLPATGIRQPEWVSQLMADYWKRR